MTHIQATGFYMVPVRDLFTAIKYGLLYNWYAATDARNICAAGAHVPTSDEFVTLSAYLGGSDVAGQKLKEADPTYWTVNTGTNEAKFNARGAGFRTDTGTFSGAKLFNNLSTITSYPPVNNRMFVLRGDADNFANSFCHRRYGLSIRPLKDSTDLEDGEEGIYMGNDGKIYRTICIGTQEWLADNLCETKYRNGDSIPEVTDAGDWAALTTGALCAYENDWDNV